VRTIGLLGGMSWESTIPYYRIINETVKEALGGLHSGKIVLVSVDFEPIERLQHAGAWSETGKILAEAARSVQNAGADCIVLCTNTMHRVASQIQMAVDIPLLHIATATGNAVTAAGITKVGLLGTRFTMEEMFYRQQLEDAHALEVLIPAESDRDTVHRIIYHELCLGIIQGSSREAFRRVLANLVRAGVQGVILGCTEISMLVQADDSAVALFDTTEIHAKYAAQWALEQDLNGGLPEG
jgi:aspartate racemase